jgi:exodeoxyribonuclease VII large subunit
MMSAGDEVGTGLFGVAHEPAFSVSEFVAVLNQTLEYAYPSVTISGELANFKVSKGRWVYFDLKDEGASVRFFGTVYMLPGPLEDGMMVSVRGVPRLHPQYGFSVSVQAIQPVGEGSIKKAAALLEAKLAAEGLFDVERKRALPYPPRRIGLVTSSESAAYRDFMKVIDARWGGVEITLVDVQVQGEAAVAQIVTAVGQLNALADPPEVLVVTRGGGSAEDLAAFSTEQVTRAVAASRIPTLVAIGHEVDVSLAELAADQRASTPSNAAELLVPDRRAMLETLAGHRQRLSHFIERQVVDARAELALAAETLHGSVTQLISQALAELKLKRQLLDAYNPQAALARGYALIRKNGRLVSGIRTLRSGDILEVTVSDGRITAAVTDVKENA